jgi:hypothetical protein
MKLLHFLRRVLYKFLVWIAAFVILLAWSVDMEGALPAKQPATPPPMRLVLMVYTSAAGHGLPLGSYVMVFRIPGFATERLCEAAGEDALKNFRAQVQPDGARLLPAYMCEEES